ncbi:MAG: hypothetical protein A2063_06695 [Gallionellales bacterium GWA2_60_142]|jgi:hypothetical protein|nr:MAG: hypothetical protein A2063_06695 [Gallionellales bacterium GWA2_60_142]HCI13164.1 hypothetical protein [Gallionellaceae bacterium]
MTLLSMLPFVPVIAIVLIIGSIVFRAPSEKLQHALAEGVIWGISSIFAFGAEILFLAHI